MLPRGEYESLVTRNGHGRTTVVPNEYSRAFIDFSRGCWLPVLDIGAAFGVASIPAIKAGATVIANDIEVAHLSQLISSVPREMRRRLVTLLARFPGGFDFSPRSLGAVHASNLFNFLTGSEIRLGLRAVRRWLTPGGKVFIVAGTPYARNVARFIPIYEARTAAGVEWPGEVYDLQSYGDDPSLNELPNFLHLLDRDKLIELFVRADFVVETAEFFDRRGLPAYLRLDGRENVGLIARVP